MTLDELSVVFSADIAPFEDAVAQVCALLAQSAAQADALTAVFRQSGVSAGHGLANGLLSTQGAVAAAARAVADAAASALRSALQIHSPSRLTYGLGKQFDEGLALGVSENAASSLQAAQSLGGGAASALDRALEVPVPLPSADAPEAPASSLLSLDIPLSLLSAPSHAAAREEAALAAALARSGPDSLPDLPASAFSRSAPSENGDGYLPLSITVPLEVDGYRLGVAAIEGINRVAQGTGRVELNL